MKKIEIYETTSLALEALRIVLEVQMGWCVRFDRHDLTVMAERKHRNESGRRWESKTQVFNGIICFVNKYGTTRQANLYAEINLSSFTSAWRTETIRFQVQDRLRPGDKEVNRWYVSHCVYCEMFGQCGGVEYPEFVLSIAEDLNMRMWRVGQSYTGVKEIPYCPAVDVPAKYRILIGQS